MKGKEQSFSSYLPDKILKNLIKLRFSTVSEPITGKVGGITGDRQVFMMSYLTEFWRHKTQSFMDNIKKCRFRHVKSSRFKFSLIQQSVLTLNLTTDHTQCLLLLCKHRRPTGVRHVSPTTPDLFTKGKNVNSNWFYILITYYGIISTIVFNTN